MGWFSATSTPENLFRTASDGQRVYAPVGKRGPLFVTSDEAAIRIQREVRGYFRWAFPVVVVGLIAIQHRWGWFSVLLIGLPANVGFRFWLARRLPRMSRRNTALLSIDRRHQLLAGARATGSATLWLLLVVASLGSVIGVAGALQLQMLEGWLLTALMSLSALIFAWQLRLLRADKRQGNTSA